MSLLHEYIAVILLDSASNKLDETLAGSISAITSGLFPTVGGNVSAEDVGAALNILEKFGAAEDDFSPLTGGYWVINYDNFKYYFIEAEAAAGERSENYLEIRREAGVYRIMQAYARRGSGYASDAAKHLMRADNDAWDILRGNSKISPEGKIPASDRVVSLNDNQIYVFTEAVENVVKNLESENSIDGDVDKRSRFIGQIKALASYFWRAL